MYIFTRYVLFDVTTIVLYNIYSIAVDHHTYIAYIRGSDSMV